ncbi:glycogen debranching protein GlgX [Poseidonocella sedimentorum]|uniref:Glycogen operon protein n=1 Tax=Poseidonocella sedimentorum TaxID=871652 RepID=A0A1I6DE24_9RHOB|nr:glycogen debranching protein GlgX [Poseidonocella sedimentorum]SFR03647.1 glycogen operon protein [Poseidonocella sedimentorum]
MTTPTPLIFEGRASPLGATFDGHGVNFAVFSQHATRMQLCLFSEDGKREMHRIDMPERTGDVWHGFIPGMRPGQKYGYRAFGPYAPEDGFRFNPNKLLIDPYAKRLTGHPVWNDALMGYKVGDPDGDLSFCERDSAPFMPRSVVEDPSFSWGHDQPPRRHIADTVIYEAHVKGATKLTNLPHAGTFLGLATDPMLDYLTDLGITAIQLLPVHAFVNDRFLVEKGLVNYWGYQTLGFFAPDPRYLASGEIAEFQQTVARLHSAGIEVILDVVYNHTCEGDQMGPTFAFRGLDNTSYYRLTDGNARYYVNDTGTGNTLNVEHPMVLRMIMDSLRYWVEVMHVDGFRFDLCATLGRTATGFDPGAAFFDAIRQDPVLTDVKLIAEPWDIGPGGYQLGSFPPPFLELNDRFRDGVRRFWRGDDGMVSVLADHLTGTAGKFDHSGRPATTSVNKITSHDGFTLADVVSYNEKHNEANGENNRDGHDANYTDNLGVEGPTDDAEILAKRLQRRRNLMATLLLSQGTPFLLAGDELGHSQKGNNNAYCQDNELTWINPRGADWEFRKLVRKLITLRREHPILRQKHFLHAKERVIDGIEDLFWWRADGTPMRVEDWQDPALRTLCAEMRTASGTPHYGAREDAIFLVFNAGPALEITLPKVPEGMGWVHLFDTAAPDTDVHDRDASTVRTPCEVAGEAVQVFELQKL